MISSAMLGPTASSRGQPNISAARSFHRGILPAARVAALALMPGPAAAQMSPPPSRPARPARGARTGRMQKEAAVNPPRQEDGATSEGTSVYGSDDGKIGHVATALMDPSSKKI